MVTLGIVGAGLRGRMYAQALGDLAGIEVVGFAEPDSRAASALPAGTAVVGSHAELLARFDPDAVIVATPDFAHRDAAVAAAGAGERLRLATPLGAAPGGAAA